MLRTSYQLTLLLLVFCVTNALAQFPCNTGNTVSAAGQGSTINLCQQGDFPIISFNNSVEALPHGFIVTDENNVIVSIGLNSNIDFSTLPGNNFQVYGFNFIGNITATVGQTLGNVSIANGCYAVSSNFISVSASGGLEGGTLDGGPFSFCVGDGMDDMIMPGNITLSGNMGGNNSAWIVTDIDGNILGLPPMLSDVNFDGAGPGECLIWNLSYDDGLQGLEVGANVSDIQGCYGLSNPISVFRNQPEGGMLEGGPFSFCVGDGMDDMIAAGDITLTGNSGSNSAWVVTDVNGNILGLPPMPSDVNFDGAGSGECLIWHLSFEDGLTGAEVGANAADLQGCYSLSNPISVFRNQPEGGMLEGGPFSFCVGDGMDDMIAAGDITLTGNSGSNSAWVVTDVNGNILGLPPMPSDVNFDGAGSGECLIWHLSFEDGLTGAEVGANAADLQGCYSLSNPISVFRNQPEGGMLEGGPFSFCVGDGMDDMITAGDITLTGNSGSNSAWVVTDVNGNILGLPPMPSDVNFDGAGSGECLIWHLSFEDGLTGAEVGANAADLQGCYSLSNPISVFRNQPEGGMLEGGPFSFCVGDGMDDMIAAGDITLTGNSGSNSAWVVTDVNGNILGLPPMPSDVNFDGAGSGECLIWHLSFEDGLTGAEVGANAADLQGCYSLSNPISVFRNQPEGGMLEGGPFSFCVGDGMDDMIAAGDITLTGNSGSNSAWVVTDVNGNILGLPPMPSDVNFDGAGSGECLIWHLSFEDGLTGAEVGANAADLQGCYSLSNPISVFRNQPEGGMLEGGPFSFCVGDGMDDMIAAGDITLTGNSGSNSAWVVTDVNGNILGLPPMPSDVNFDGAGSGECLIWHLSFEDGLTGAEVGANAADLQGCYSLSNPISVFRNQSDGSILEGGMLEGGPFSFCVGDGMDDMIAAGDITLTGNSGSNSAWVVTDVNGNILGLPPMPSDVNFDGAGSGECLIWHLSFEDGLMGAEVGANAADLQGCYSLSNPISVFRIEVNGGMVMTEDGETEITITVGDSLDNIIHFDSIDVVGDQFTYVITDDNNVILAVPGGDQVNFEGAGIGVCRVWGLAYTGDITAVPGDTASIVDLTDGCFDLSDNFITVIREGNLIDPEIEILTDEIIADIVITPWPNPTSRTLNIRIKQKASAKNASISIINFSGNVIRHIELDGDAEQQQLELDVTNFPGGIYNILYRSEKTQKSERFIKQ